MEQPSPHEEPTVGGTVIFGYDHLKQLAFVALLHDGEADFPPHLDSQVYLPWAQVPLLVERIAQLFDLMDSPITIYEQLLREGMPQREAQEKAQVMAQRQREIGEQ